MVGSSFPMPLDALSQGVRSPKVDSQRALNSERTLNLSTSSQQIGCWILNAWRGNSELQEPKPLVYLQQAPMVASRQAAWTDD